MQLRTIEYEEPEREFHEAGEETKTIENPPKITKAMNIYKVAQKSNGFHTLSFSNKITQNFKNKNEVSKIANNNQIDAKVIEYGLSIGKKIKASNVDDINTAKKLFSFGVNFINTNKLSENIIS